MDGCVLRLTFFSPPPFISPTCAYQIHYIVGDNGNGSGNGFSYIIGFNKRFPKAPHHRTASCGKDGCLCTTDASAFTVYGALVGASCVVRLVCLFCRLFVWRCAGVVGRGPLSLWGGRWW